MEKIGMVMKVKLLIVLLFCIFNVNAETVSCGTVTNKALFLKKNEYKLILSDGEGRYLNKNTVRVLPKGKHSLKARIIINSMNVYVNPSFNNFSDNQLSEPVEFSLVVNANVNYQLVAMKTGSSNNGQKQTFKIVIKKMSDKECEFDDTRTSLKAKNSFVDSQLPAELQYRLNLVMKDISQHLQKKSINNEEVIYEYPKQVITTLGIVVDSKQSSKHGIKVLAITPFSLASKIGLLPKDNIISINGNKFLPNESNKKPVEDNIKRFKTALTNVVNDETFTINVHRDDKIKELIIRVEDITLPSYRVSIDVF